MTYLGETPVALEDSPYKDITPTQLAMCFNERYGQVDGAHHKAWVLDQMARALLGSPIENLRVARWDDHPEEWRFELGASAAYLAWVEQMRGATESDGSREYGYDEGIPP